MSRRIVTSSCAVQFQRGSGLHPSLAAARSSQFVGALGVALSVVLVAACSSDKNEEPGGTTLPGSTTEPTMTATATTTAQTGTGPQMSTDPTAAPTPSTTGTPSNTGTATVPTMTTPPATNTGTSTTAEPTGTPPAQSTAMPMPSVSDAPTTSASGGGDGGTGGAPLPSNSAPAGSGGAGGGDTAPPTGGLGCTGNELLCEDFESTAVGSVPMGAWHALDDSCQYQMMTFSMGVSDEQKNGGSHSLKITNKHFAQCRLSGAFDAANDFWVRTYEYWEAGLDLSNRETLAVDLTPGYRSADDPAVRFGNRSKAPCEEYAGPQVTIIGLAGGEYTGCGSRTLPQGEWYCFEAHIQQASNLTIQTYINGEAISYQSTGKPETDSIGTESPLSEKLDNIRLGIFSTGEATGNVYIDDVAVSTTRIGCAQ